MVREYRVLMQLLLDVVDEQGFVRVTDRDKVISLVTRAIEEASEVFYQARQVESQQAKRQAEQLAEEGTTFRVNIPTRGPAIDATFR